MSLDPARPESGGVISPEDQSKIDSITPIGYGDYAATVPMNLTSGLQKVNAWNSLITPIGMEHEAGKITVTEAAAWYVILEHQCSNTDRSPDIPIVITVEVRKNGSEVIFSRDTQISAATATDEPAVASFTTAAILPIDTGGYFEIFLSANEAGADPDDVTLDRMRITAHVIANLP